MLYRPLAGLEAVSALCLGCGPFGSQLPATRAYDLLDAFARAGGNFIDTAHIYGAWAPQGENGGCGNSEVTIGRWLRQNGNRDQIIVATKGGHPDFATGETRLTCEGLRGHLQQSLDHLGTDYIDLYYLHRDDRDIPVSEILDWLSPACATGVIRHLACSNWRTDRLQLARDLARTRGLPLLVTNQIGGSLAQLNTPVMCDRYGEQVGLDAPTVAYYAQHQLPLSLYSAQAGGLFAKLDALPADNATPPDPATFPRPMLLQRYGNPLTFARHRAARRLAREKACTSQQLALAWLLQQPFPTFPVIGPTSVDQLQDSLAALQFPLSPREINDLSRGDPIFS